MTTLNQLWMVHSLGWTLLHFCWQGTVVALLLWCALSLLGERHPRARYAAACCALALMVVLPLATLAHVGAEEYRLALLLRQAPVDAGAGLLIVVGTGGGAPWWAGFAQALDRSLGWVLLAWFAGAMVFLARLNVGLIVARRLRTIGTTAAPAELEERFARLRQRLGVERAVRLMNSVAVQVPTVIGWLRPVVLLPVSCFTGLTEMQIEAILGHELAHIRRHDYLVSVVQSVVEALLFYHPGVWWVSKQVRRERECCCDALAVAVGGDVLAYARALSALEARRSLYPEVALGANGGVLTMRIKRLLGGAEATASSQVAAGVVLVAMVVAAGASVGTMKAETRNSAPSTTAAVEVRSLTPAKASAGRKAHAAQPDGALQGVVFDPTGAVLPQVAVTVTNEETGVRLTRETDATGRYSVAELVAGNYDVAASMPGFRDALQRVRVDAAQQVRVNLKMDVGKVTEHVDVTPAALPAMSGSVAQPTMQDAPLRVSGGVMAGQLVSKAQPVYPPDAKAAHVSGAVVLHALIAKEGTVQTLQVVSGPEMLRASAMDAVRQWVYKPFLLNNEPVAVDTTITVNYHFGGEDVAPEQKTVEPSSANDAGGIKVSGGVMAGQLISKAQPMYPPEAKAAHITGTVVLKAVIAKDGTVEDLQLVSGPKELAGSAIDAVRQWIYKPYLLNGEPTEVQTTININFNMNP